MFNGVIFDGFINPENLHLCTFKTSTKWEERGDADCAFKMRNGVKDSFSLKTKNKEKMTIKIMYNIKNNIFYMIQREIHYFVMYHIPCKKESAKSSFFL